VVLDDLGLVFSINLMTFAPTEVNRIVLFAMAANVLGIPITNVGATGKLKNNANQAF
jgi:hypothetical protein